jgi:putative ABC transport system permease protein
MLALREARRSWGRFSLLTAAVALLVLLLLFFQAVGGALTTGLVGAVERVRTDVFVYDERARRNPLASLLDEAAVDAVAGVDGVAEAAGVGIAGFVATIGGLDEDVVVIGQPQGGPMAPGDVADGRRPERRGEALVAAGFGADVAVGTTVTYEGGALTVVGTADEAAYAASTTLYVTEDEYVAAVRARAADGALSVPPSFVAATVDDGADPAAVAERVQAAVGGVEALARDDAVDALPGVSTVTRSFGILDGLLFVVVTITTGVFFLILTVQKQDALVLLRAVGARRRDVVLPVLAQVLGVTVGGALLGALAAAGLLAAAQATFGAALDPAAALRAVTSVGALGVLASLGALRRVLAVDPIEATTGGGL